MKTSKLALFLACLLSLLFLAGQASAGTMFVDFGTTEGTNISPFSTDYAAMPSRSGPSYPGHYYVAKSGYGFGLDDWGGYDHTSSDHSGCFMVVNGSENSGQAVLSYTVANAVAGQEYKMTGWVMEIQSTGGPNAILSFRVNGQEQGHYDVQGAQAWWQFGFTYTPTTSGSITFALHDNQVTAGMNDFGLDDLSLTGPGVVPLPASVLLLGSGLLGLAGWRWRTRKG